MVYPLLKRTFDIAMAGLLLCLFAIPMLMIAGLVRIRLGSPVIFRQVRTGYKGRLFTIYKFRTMHGANAAGGNDANRMTAFGSRLRRLSVDELPQLWNVLKGDVSFVGPRPLLPEYLPLYSPVQARRHEVKPGLTGWAQVNGRNALTWAQKFDYDVWYVEHCSFWLDLKILCRTIVVLLQSQGISQPGHATAERFTGNVQLDALKTQD